MSIHIPRVGLIRMLNEIIGDSLTLRLFSNNLILAPGNVTASFTEVVGGGYTAVPLSSVSWTVTSGNPSTAVYNSIITFTFTGNTTGPKTVFGYYVTRASGEVVSSGYLTDTQIPYVPAAGCFIKITPKFSLDNAQ